LWLLRSLIYPMVLVFFVAAVFSHLSGDTVRAVYFVVVGLALAWDRATRRDRLPGPAADDAGFSGDSVARRRAATGRVVAAAGLGGLVYAVVVGSFKRYSVPATIAITALAFAALVVAWRTSAGSAAPARRLNPVGIAAWAAVALGAAVWEVLALFLQPTFTTDSPAHPTLSYLANGLLASWPGRSAVIFGWLAFGWYLARL
jgi:hypothetical protein